MTRQHPLFRAALALAFATPFAGCATSKAPNVDAGVDADPSRPDAGEGGAGEGGAGEGGAGERGAGERGAGEGGAGERGAGEGGAGEGGAGERGAGNAPADPLADHGDVVEVTGGRLFLEGPTWDAGNHRLLFSDVPGNTIFAWDGSVVTTFRSPSGDANGLLVQPDGALLACEHRNRRVTRTGTDGVVTTLAEKLGGKRLNGPNDVIARSDGNIYFTDPPYDVPLDQRDLDFQGVYRIDASGVLHLEHTGMTAPNGAALSLDEGTLYVGDSEDNFILQFAIHEDGSLAPPTPFVASVPNPDGMVTDDAGRLFVASIDGVRVFGTDGAPLGLLAVPTDIPSNVTFGDDDRRTLYITTRAKLFSVRLATPGHP